MGRKAGTKRSKPNYGCRAKEDKAQGSMKMTVVIVTIFYIHLPDRVTGDEVRRRRGREGGCDSVVPRVRKVEALN